MGRGRRPAHRRRSGASIGYYKEPDDELPDSIRSNNLVLSSPKVFGELKALLV
jgi:hypothetical protein